MRDKTNLELKYMWQEKLLQQGIRTEEELEDATVVQMNESQDNWYLGFERPIVSMQVSICGVQFCISTFAHCCGMFVISNLNVDSRIHARFKLVRCILDILMKDMAIGALIYTTVPWQNGTINYLSKSGFKQLKGSTFTNPRTTNEITTWIRFAGDRK